MPRLAARGRSAYALSLRGHGASPRPRFPRLATLGDYVEDVAQAVARIGRPPVLVGHSMGGLLVQRYLAEGGRAVGVALLAPAPLGGALGVTLRILRRHPLVVLEANLTWRLWPLVRSPARARELLLPWGATDAEAAAVHARLGDESFLAYLGMLAPRIDPSRVRVPVLVLAAGADRLFTPEEVAATARAHGAAAEVVPGAAHDLMIGPTGTLVADRLVAWADGLRALPAGAGAHPDRAAPPA
jgi:alpha-beta hydrolase superfamily lysophospholipase